MEPSTDLLERDEATSALSELIAAAVQGRGRTLFLVSEAGLGKTALLSLARTMAQPTLTVRDMRGSVMERDLPFASAGQLFDLGAQGEANLEPEGRRSAVHELARVRVREWSSVGPTLLACDELQWVDPASLSVLGFLCRRISGLPVACVATLRPWPAAALEMAEAMTRDGMADLIRLPSLSLSSTSHLLGRLTDLSIDHQLTRRTFALTDGNPLLITEAARAMRDQGELPSGTGLHQALLLSHLGGLPERAIACARTAAVLGRRVSIGVIEQVADMPADSFAEVLDMLLHAGVLRSSAGEVEFSHDLLASAVYNDTPAGTRHLLHARAFSYYFDLGSHAAASPHAIAAKLLGDERAIIALTTAGRAALAAGAFESGVSQMEAAVSLAGDHPSDDLLAAYAHSLFAASRHVEAVQAYRRLLVRELDPNRRTEVLAAATQAQIYTGDLKGALAGYDDLIDSEQLGPTAVLVQLERAHVIWELKGPVTALAALDERPKVAGLPGTEMLALLGSYYRLEMGDPTGLGLLEAAVDGARRRVESSPQEALTVFNVFTLLAVFLSVLERFDETEVVANAGLSWLRAAGAPHSSGLPLGMSRIGTRLREGRLHEALSEIDDLEEEMDLSSFWRMRVDMYRCSALIMMGRLEEAEQLIAIGPEMPGQDAWHSRLILRQTRGELALARGEPKEAAAQFTEAEEIARHAGTSACTPLWADSAVEAYLSIGDLTATERVVEWIERTSAAMPGPWSRMTVLGGRAGLAAARGDHATAKVLYQEALSLPCNMPLSRDAILLRYGSYLRRRSELLEARPVLAEVLADAESRGAELLVQAAAAELAAAKGRRRRRNDPTALTPQEARVMELALTGSTTREMAEVLFLSPRTIETHLSRVFAKLDVSSKTELRRLQRQA